MLHPRMMLSNAAQAVFQVAQVGKSVIDAEFVNAAMDTKVIQTADVTDDIAGAL